MSDARQVPDANLPSVDELAAAVRVAGLSFTRDELELMRATVAKVRGWLGDAPTPAWHEAPVEVFTPLAPGIDAPEDTAHADGFDPATRDVSRPQADDELLFADVATLAALVQGRQVRCVELAELFLDRLRAIDGPLRCVIELTEERALAQAGRLDEELAAGRSRGPLHGIPWGAKDLLAVRGTRTTWGARPYAEQRIEQDATVVQRLDAAGAVLLAKLSLGALAMGDVWFGGTTKNPWNPTDGSCGSSAGSAAAVAAGGVPFAIGSETRGSITSPSARCGASSLRPTFGRVPRTGAMPLAWSLDKLGPMARSAFDAALVFDAIHGPDGHDASVRERPFVVPAPVEIAGRRIGFLPADRERDPAFATTLNELVELGARLVEVEVPSHPLDALYTTLDAQAASVFDELTRSNRDDLLVAQDPTAWPNWFRSTRVLSAVDYVRMQRLRGRLMRDFAALMGTLDLLAHPTTDSAGRLVSVTNLTGHPCFSAPSGVRADGTPTSVTLGGQLDGDATLLGLARTWQEATGHHCRHPVLDGV